MRTVLAVVLAVLGTSACDLRSLPRGDPPGLAHLAGQWYVGADGKRTRLATPHGAQGVVRWRDSFLVADTRWFEGTNGLTLVGPDGRVRRSWPSSGSPVAARDGRVAWTRVTVSEALDPGPTAVFVGYPDGPVARQRLRAGVVSVVGFAGPYVVFERRWRRGFYVTDLVQPPRRLPGRLLRPKPGLPPLPFEVRQTSREDGSHVLVVVVDGDHSAVLRIGRDGRVERATRVRHLHDPLDPPYVLTPRP